MVSLSQLKEDGARSEAGMDRSNIIVNLKVLREELMKIYYAKDVDIIMENVGSCDMKKPEPKKIKCKKGEITITDDIDFRA